MNNETLNITTSEILSFIIHMLIETCGVNRDIIYIYREREQFGVYVFNFPVN